MDKINLSIAALSEIGDILRNVMNTQSYKEEPIFSRHSDLIGDMINFRLSLEYNIINGDVNNGGHFNVYIYEKFMTIKCCQSDNTTTVFL